MSSKFVAIQPTHLRSYDQFNNDQPKMLSRLEKVLKPDVDELKKDNGDQNSESPDLRNWIKGKSCTN